MGEYYYIAIDERQDVTIHQYEPHYNSLHGKWKSGNGGTYVNKNMINMVVNNPIDMNLLKACCYELDVLTYNNNKQNYNNVIKIYK